MKATFSSGRKERVEPALEGQVDLTKVTLEVS
jgi:hypothetical protein